ncbi:MAG: potassium channel family protein [Flavobacteriales bacterium]|nr:potassium channel family protein [Flavobacteriales bacterium]
MSRARKTIWIIGFAGLYLSVLALMVWFESDAKNANIKSFYDALWYSIITLTTVGYGDFYPVTTGGKIVSLIIIISSLGVLGYLLTQISRTVSEYVNRKKMGLNGTNMKNHFVVIGWNSFANQVLTQIIRSNHPMAVVTDKKEDIEVIRSIFSKDQLFTLYNDHKDYEGLTNVNITGAASILVNFENDTETLVYIINLKKRFGDLNFVALLESHELRETFESIGVHHTISKNSITSKLIASYLFEPDVAKITDDLMSTSLSEKDLDLLQFKIIEGNEYINNNCLDAFRKLKEEYNAVLIGLCRTENGQNQLIKNPDRSYSVLKNYYMIIMADGKKKRIIEKEFGVKEGRVVNEVAD